MKNKTAIITWVTYCNFGTFLQAYALQRYLMDLGITNTILDDSSMIISPINLKYRLKKFLMRISNTDYRKFEHSIKQANRLFGYFKNELLNIDKDILNLSSVNAKYDTFICGSDQIWNPFSLENPNADYYYASFTTKKKIAYAPSIGVSEVPQQYKEKLKKLTSCFDFLSAREQQGVDILRELTGKEVVKVVDPTLLLDREQWNVLLPKNVPCEENYILAYFLTPNIVFINAALEYARKKGLRLKMFFLDKSYKRYDCDLITAGPIEFLHYVRDAKCLFTDSFHGSIFASIFHTQFFTFKRFKQTVKNQNSRVENLLKIMNISERLLDEENYNNINELSDIDFSSVDYNLGPFIKKSKEYIKKAIQ